ncbi:MAG: YqgE/AlgH family protein [Gammaproteobacteria bacterium]
MANQDFFTNHLLIAMPTLGDPNFSQTVTFICEHTAEGALGIIVNRPLDVQLGDVFEQLSLTAGDERAAQAPVFAGGPVQQERGFVIHRPIGEWEATLQVDDDIGVTSSRDILVAMAEGRGPEQSLVALGYAGWGAGQLEAEVAENSWLSVPADERILFETPSEKRWEEAARLLGVDLNLLSGDAGHA